MPISGRHLRDAEADTAVIPAIRPDMVRPAPPAEPPAPVEGSGGRPCRVVVRSADGAVVDIDQAGTSWRDVLAVAEATLTRIERDRR